MKDYIELLTYIYNKYEIGTSIAKRYEVFKDYYGEDRVDLQIFSVDDFIKCLEFEDIFKYIPSSILVRCKTDKTELANIRSSTLNKLTTQQLEILKDAIDDKGAPLVTKIINFMRDEGYNYRIAVYYPKIRVTNEKDNFIDITEAYVYINMSLCADIATYISMQRAEYTVPQLASRYMHSHAVRILDDVSTTSNMCLGYGPIGNTIISITKSADEDLIKLFCFELDKYLSVESIEGGPYVYISDVRNNNGEIMKRQSSYLEFSAYNGIEENDIEDFTRYVCGKGGLKFSFNNGSYSIGMNHGELVATMTNYFIDFCRECRRDSDKFPLERLLFRGALEYGYINEDTVCTTSKGTITRLRDILSIKDKQVKITTFKGKDIYLNVIDDTEYLKGYVPILKYTIIVEVVYKILALINYGYGRNKKISKKTRLCC